MSSTSISAGRGADRHRGYQVQRVVGLGRGRETIERQLEEQGVVLPFAQRAEWLRMFGYPDSTLLVAADENHSAHAAVAIAIGRSRTLPGHRIYKIERFGATESPEAADQLLSAIADAARTDRRCIRVRIELFERDPHLRQRLAYTLKELGFVKSEKPESYVRTPCLDLSPSEEELFAKVAASARRNVRAPMKRGFELAHLDDSGYAERIEQLIDEAYRRTGGKPRRLPWKEILGASRTTPNRSRVVGLLTPNDKSPAGLVSFAWGCVNGNYVTYEAGASTRHHGVGNLAVAYAPLWNLIAWAKRQGAAWFDFGGVSEAAGVPHDPLAGIADFKRFFSGHIIEVGEQWILEPRRIRAMIARALSAAVRRSRALTEAATPIALPPADAR
jgi:hypothetical protein